MTLFQMMAVSLLYAFSTLIPLPEVAWHFFGEMRGLEIWATLCSSALILVFFRYDVLSFLIGALSVTRSGLDSTFFKIIFLSLIPLFIPESVFDPLQSPWITGGALGVLGFLFGFSQQWSKQSVGPNHCNPLHGLIGLSAVMITRSTHTPALAGIWIGFALANFQFDLILRISAVFAAVSGLVRTLPSAFDPSSELRTLDVTFLNGFAITALVLFSFWIVLELIQKSFGPGLYRLLRGVFFIAAGISLFLATRS